jgi:small subunit ribosomal protein S6
MEYELLFFTSVSNEDNMDSIKREIVQILEGLGAKPAGDFTDIGKRKLAYPIKRNTHAFFSFVRFTLDEKQNIPEIEKRLSLFDKVIRHIIVRADEIGKTAVSQEIKIEQKKPEKAFKKTVEAPKMEAPSAPAKPKAALSDLDEKLTEILEETPE